MGREVKGGGLEIIRSMSLLVFIPKEYSNLEDLKGSTTHSNKILSTLGWNVQLNEELGDVTFGHEGARTLLLDI